MMFYLLNFILCLIIIGLGLWVFNTTHNNIAIYIVCAFGLFGLSHLASMIGISKDFGGFFMFLRTLGYILMIIALTIEALNSVSKDI